MIQERIRQGVYIKDVAEELGVHPRTVSRALQRGASPPGERPAARKSKLDRYKPLIDRLLAAGVWNAAVILREIQEHGYPGQASILRDYIRPKRPLRQARATVRFETAPGEQLQNDWAQYRTQVNGRMQEVHFAVNTLGYSRRFHFVAMACEDAEHTYESLIQSFEYFGGVTSEVLVDNQKTEVISHRVGAASRDPPQQPAVEQMVLGISTRRYARSLEPLPEAIAARGTSKSAVSERFVYGIERKLADLMSRELRGLPLVALLIDGVHFAEHVVLAAVGVDERGQARTRIARGRDRECFGGAGIARRPGRARIGSQPFPFNRDRRR